MERCDVPNCTICEIEPGILQEFASEGGLQRRSNFLLPAEVYTSRKGWGTQTPTIWNAHVTGLGRTLFWQR